MCTSWKIQRSTNASSVISFCFFLYFGFDTMFPLIHDYFNVNKQLDLHYICTRLYSVRLKEFKNLFEKSGKSHFLTFLHRITDSDPWLWILLIIGFINLNRKTAHAPRYFFSYLSMPIRESMPLIIAIFLIIKSSVQHPTIFQDKVNSLYFLQ